MNLRFVKVAHFGKWHHRKAWLLTTCHTLTNSIRTHTLPHKKLHRCLWTTFTNFCFGINSFLIHALLLFPRISGETTHKFEPVWGHGDLKRNFKINSKFQISNCKIFWIINQIIWKSMNLNQFVLNYWQIMSILNFFSMTSSCLSTTYPSTHKDKSIYMKCSSNFALFFSAWMDKIPSSSQFMNERTSN